MGGVTFCPLLLAALMRDVMAAMFSMRCFARWGFTCISSAMVVVSVQEVACVTTSLSTCMWGINDSIEAPHKRSGGISNTFTSAMDTFPDLPKEEVYIGYLYTEMSQSSFKFPFCQCRCDFLLKLLISCYMSKTKLAL